jgi:multiple antibiotic resistance protein
MGAFNFQDFVSAFIVLFAIIDVTGSVPIIVDLQQRHKNFSPLKASFYSLLVLLGFFFVGEWILRLFSVDISSFAVAGSVVLFVIACEMTFGWELFKMDGPGGNATMVPIIFPLLAGPGAFTALLSLKAEYSSLVIILALMFNMAIAYLVLKHVDWVEKSIGAGGVYVLRKFFGVILLAIAVKLFMGNITSLLVLGN